MAGETAVLNNKEENPPYSADMPAMYEMCGVRGKGAWLLEEGLVIESRRAVHSAWRNGDQQ